MQFKQGEFVEYRRAAMNTATVPLHGPQGLARLKVGDQYEVIMLYPRHPIYGDIVCLRTPRLTSTDRHCDVWVNSTCIADNEDKLNLPEWF